MLISCIDESMTKIHWIEAAERARKEAELIAERARQQAELPMFSSVKLTYGPELNRGRLKYWNAAAERARKLVELKRIQAEMEEKR